MRLFNYRQDDFAVEILQRTQQQGVNVIIDFIGAKYLSAHLRLLQIAGRLVIVGLMGGSTAEIDLQSIQKKRLQLKGLAMRTKPIAEKRAITTSFKDHWLPLFRTGTLKPVIDSVYPYTDVKAAHERMENNLNSGKIILRM